MPATFYRMHRYHWVIMAGSLINMMAVNLFFIDSAFTSKPLHASAFPARLVRNSACTSSTPIDSNFDGIQQNDPTCPKYHRHEHYRLDFL